MYFFSVRKCGNVYCSKCKSLRLPLDIFETLHHLLDPCPDTPNEVNYLSFEDLYETQTMEIFKP